MGVRCAVIMACRRPLPTPVPLMTDKPTFTQVPDGDPSYNFSVADKAAITGGDDISEIANPQSKSVGRYELGEEIARGGMGIIYRATDIAFGREVAVKVLREKYGPASMAAHLTRRRAR